jgi:TM2 domain-containing membrane protein YozV
MESDNLFQAQRKLSEKDLIIYNSELLKKSKSVGLAYFLLIFFGGLGLHKFYLGKVVAGIAYLIVGTINFIFLQIIIFNADKYWKAPDFLVTLFVVSSLFLLFDLFTLSTQISEHEKEFRVELLAQFGIVIINEIIEDDNYTDDSFIDNEDGTVTHKLTGLMWQRFSIGQTWDGATCNGKTAKMSWDEAINVSSDFAGYSDWRLPTKEELISLVLKVDSKSDLTSKQDINNSMSTINPKYFPKTKKESYWTSSLHAKHSSSAWNVNFSDGNFNSNNKGYSYFVRLVR